MKRREVLRLGFDVAAALGLSTQTALGQSVTLRPRAAGPPSRSAKARAIRVAAAQAAAATARPSASNGDDERYHTRIASFSKTLPHNELGEVDGAAYAALLRALRSGRPADFETVPLGGVIRLANPQASFTFDLEGPDSHEIAIDPAPAFASTEMAAEACELYWHAL